MKRFFKTVGMLLVCVALLTPTVDGRGRNNNGESKSPQTSHSQQSRPGNMGRPTHGSTRPGNSGSVNRPNNEAVRPGNNHRPDNGYRPGNNGGNNHRPDNGNRPGNNGGNHRPDNGYRPGNNGNNHRPDNGYRPGHNGGNNHRPDNGYRPGHNNWNNPGRPNHPEHWGQRPHHIPHFAGWHRPAPPRHWRPAPHWRPFRSILGITLGTGFGISVNALINNGYNVNYYGDNTVYLSNVPMLNMNWPDAVLYYNGGGLCGSRFVYSTGYYDMNRYNMVYTTLINNYGMPVSVQNTAAGIEATWWGTGNQFIRLGFQSDYAQNGSLRYFTTLSFGN